MSRDTYSTTAIENATCEWGETSFVFFGVVRIYLTVTRSDNHCSYPYKRTRPSAEKHTIIKSGRFIFIPPIMIHTIWHSSHWIQYSPCMTWLENMMAETEFRLSSKIVDCLVLVWPFQFFRSKKAHSLIWIIVNFHVVRLSSRLRNPAVHIIKIAVCLSFRM